MVTIPWGDELPCARDILTAVDGCGVFASVPPDSDHDDDGFATTTAMAIMAARPSYVCLRWSFVIAMPVCLDYVQT